MGAHCAGSYRQRRQSSALHLPGNNEHKRRPVGAVPSPDVIRTMVQPDSGHLAAKQPADELKLARFLLLEKRRVQSPRTVPEETQFPTRPTIVSQKEEPANSYIYDSKLL